MYIAISKTDKTDAFEFEHGENTFYIIKDGAKVEANVNNYDIVEADTYKIVMGVWVLHNGDFPETVRKINIYDDNLNFKGIGIF